MTLLKDNLNHYDEQIRLSFLLGVLLAGNLLDNISNPRTFTLVLQLLLAISWILTGIHVTFAIPRGCDSVLFIGSIEMIGEIFASGIVLISII